MLRVAASDDRIGAFFTFFRSFLKKTVFVESGLAAVVEFEKKKVFFRISAISPLCNK